MNKVRVPNYTIYMSELEFNALLREMEQGLLETKPGAKVSQDLLYSGSVSSATRETPRPQDKP
ncbi:hypothetical protein WKK05_37130 (plasmid) [Nostoc sp. UHCC 0302]|uniref:hypothetical protein n=1 Tax=Nostoc sp. UHCC 0302 TaxID=3134896 RepID=UPI00311CA750